MQRCSGVLDLSLSASASSMAPNRLVSQRPGRRSCGRSRARGPLSQRWRQFRRDCVEQVHSWRSPAAAALPAAAGAAGAARSGQVQATGVQVWSALRSNQGARVAQAVHAFVLAVWQQVKAPTGFQLKGVCRCRGCGFAHPCANRMPKTASLADVGFAWIHAEAQQAMRAHESMNLAGGSLRVAAKGDDSVVVSRCGNAIFALPAVLCLGSCGFVPTAVAHQPPNTRSLRCAQ